MTRVLVAEDHTDVRDLLSDILYDLGFDVIEAKDGGVALERASADTPDLILLDVSMPVMDGWEVLKGLKENPSTKQIPVVMVTALKPNKGQLTAWRMGAKHYIAKPFTEEQVKLAVKVAIREAAEAPGAEKDLDGEQQDSDAPPRRTAIGTGSVALDQILGDGIPLASLTLIEGTPKSGKSVLCQHITHEGLLDGLRVAYFISDTTANDFLPQMGSIGLPVTEYSRSGKLRIYPIGEPGLDEGPDCVYTPGQMMVLLAEEMAACSSESDVIIVDALTTLASESDDRDTLRFFTSCRRLCDDGKTVVLATRSYAIDDRMLSRLRDICDGYLRLRMQMLATRQGTVLEVLKTDKMELSTNNTISFEVEAGEGMRVVSFGKFRA